MWERIEKEEGIKRERKMMGGMKSSKGLVRVVLYKPGC